MSKWEDLKRAKLGEASGGHGLGLCSKAVYGGIAWPGKRPGFAAVLAMSHDRHFESYDIYLLDEFESFDTRELVRRCGIFNHKYNPDVWIGDRRNDAGDRFIHEMNDEFELPQRMSVQERQFFLTSTPVLEMEQLYQYILPSIKKLLDPERRQLFLRDSRVLNYLREVELNDITELELGHYPAIEAIAFAVLEMLQRGDDHLLHDPDDDGVTDLLSIR